MTSMKKPWPYPGDAPVTRARKMTGAYRAVAQATEPAVKLLREMRASMGSRNLYRDAVDEVLDAIDKLESTEELDKRFTDWGETWHCPQVHNYDEDDLVPTKIAADIACLSPGHLGNLRIRGRIDATFDRNIEPRGGFRYRVGDLHKLATEVRKRNWHGRKTSS